MVECMKIFYACNSSCYSFGLLDEALLHITKPKTYSFSNITEKIKLENMHSSVTENPLYQTFPLAPIDHIPFMVLNNYSTLDFERQFHLPENMNC